MTAEDKTSLYWTAGIVIGLVILLAAAGFYLGWFETVPVPQA